MKILIVNTSDLGGGAAKASYRLHTTLLNSGIDSIMLVQNKLGDDYSVVTPDNKIEKLIIGKIRPILDVFPLKIYRLKTKALFSSACVPFSHIIKIINKINPDIVHLHWVNSGMIRIEDVKKIKAPIVWSLHDMWPFTGGCHYDSGCGKYRNICFNCPVLKSNRKKDLANKIFKRKMTVYSQKNNMTIVGLSKWMEGCARGSKLFNNYRIVNIPNPIDTEIYKPIPKKTARKIMNITTEKKLVLFGAMGVTSDSRKGFKEISEALKIIKRDDFELIIFGCSKPKNIINSKFKVHYSGLFHDDISLKVLYNAADVMIVPSLQENLSNTIMESLSCGTPVVGFNIGGNKDMVEHRYNGYLAKPNDCKDLAAGISWILDSSNYDELSNNAREKVLREFDSKVVGKRYIKLYNEIITT